MIANEIPMIKFLASFFSNYGYGTGSYERRSHKM